MLKGWYYLHTNGELIYKVAIDNQMFTDFMESPFVVAFWPVNPGDREGAWRILVESLAAGAKPERVKEIALKWKCDDEDAKIYAERVGVLLGVDGNKVTATRIDFQDLMMNPAGFGDTALEAMADLCKKMGYIPGKPFCVTFDMLLNGGPKNGNEKSAAP